MGRSRRSDARSSARVGLVATVAAALMALAGVRSGGAQPLVEPPALRQAVVAGTLPPIVERLPSTPLRTPAAGEPGRSGGSIVTLVAGRNDARLMTAFGYARLVGYDSSFRIAADIAQSLTAVDGRTFTITLREGHRWSDGHPFTTEDFRYWWEDVANDRRLSPAGLPREMLVDGRPPRVEIIDARTIRFAWESPNPYFEEALARASPLFVFRPAHYLKQFHAKYADPAELARRMAEARAPTWMLLHERRDSMYRNDNPDLPSLNPWVNASRGPGAGERMVFERNPYFHRVDGAGMQLPYLDSVVFAAASTGLMATKAGLGEADLQARYLRFADYTFLRRGAARFGFDVRLWETGTGSQVALFPNLNAADPVWRGVLRDARVRRALSLAIDREDVNETVFLGLASPSNNTVRPSSPLFREEYRTRYAVFDAAAASKLLDEAGVTRSGARGMRALPDGRPATVIIETAGDSVEESDVLRLVTEHWAAVGIQAVVKRQTRENLRLRVASGATLMAVWSGIENASPRPESSPRELAPAHASDLQWPRWGAFYESSGARGEACDHAEACRLLDLLRAWERSTDQRSREAAWRDMLAVHADQQFSIGIVAGVPQPVVVGKRLRNVPQTALYAWHPGAFFGAYRPDLFWVDP